MSVTSLRSVTVEWSSDIGYSQEFSASSNPSGSGQTDLNTLNVGNTTINVPANCIAVTIIPPAGNINPITLKGASGDTGISIHLTDPTSIGLNGVTSFILSVTTLITGVRTIFS